jgi:hypothetical protein
MYILTVHFADDTVQKRAYYTIGGGLADLVSYTGSRFRHSDPRVVTIQKVDDAYGLSIELAEGAAASPVAAV